MNTTTLTIANDDTVLIPATPGRHRRPSVLARVRRYVGPEPVPTVVILLGIVLMVAGVVAAAAWPAPVSPGARWDPQPVAVAPVVHAVPRAWIADEGDGPIVEADPGYPGDDNHDGVVDEDESGWACWSMGNHRCRPEPLRHRSS